MADDDSPLIHALPPASDYLTYLTIVEYNLTPHNLPTLHHVLQDEKLTTNIGWDLVHLLVPLLPDSQTCLHDIARLGNPREVILKVTESLRLIEYEEEEPDHPEPDHVGEALSGLTDSKVRAEASTWPVKTKGVEDEQIPKQMVELPPPLPLPVDQFIALLSMLAILHPRIKTKYPSRFLSSTLQAILASFSKATTHREEMVRAIVSTIKSVHGVQRPTLPSRKSSGMINTVTAAAAASSSTTSAADPEGASDIETSAEEKAMIVKLLQSFVTHIIEESTPSGTSPGEGDELAETDHDDEDEPPHSANDIPLSRCGSVMLYAARHVSTILYDKPPDTVADPFDLFPDHHDLLRTCLAFPTQGALGTEPPPLLDALLALGLLCIERDHLGEPADDDHFTEYLQVTALLASHCPSPNLRAHAHYLTTTTLRSHPSEPARLAFIRDTLEHCPFENLRAVAVGWIKGEILEANPTTPRNGTHAPPSIFSTPLPLQSLAPSLFPRLPPDTDPASLSFQSNLLLLPRQPQLRLPPPLRPASARETGHRRTLAGSGRRGGVSRASPGGCGEVAEGGRGRGRGPGGGVECVGGGGGEGGGGCEGVGGNWVVR
ncbi:DUF1760-domain-containing protein [Teratosphaeria destructans]|uniref:DUF1760-domain-containing protein n=1 Tax=Teratosphaeria destructans TaxID=418781 RepID=A0A9W7SY94_9PEZI|nr:DUF1760-domain-containing protein [Teratosphaeria destructans]